MQLKFADSFKTSNSCSLALWALYACVGRVCVYTGWNSEVWYERAETVTNVRVNMCPETSPPKVTALFSFPKFLPCRSSVASLTRLGAESKRTEQGRGAKVTLSVVMNFRLYTSVNTAVSSKFRVSAVQI
jgi:hypothetical protein